MIVRRYGCHITVDARNAHSRKGEIGVTITFVATGQLEILYPSATPAALNTCLLTKGSDRSTTMALKVRYAISFSSSHQISTLNL